MGPTQDTEQGAVVKVFVWKRTWQTQGRLSFKISGYKILMDLFQMINARPGFSSDGKFWLVPQEHSVANQYDDNDLDVAYYTQVRNGKTVYRVM